MCSLECGETAGLVTDQVCGGRLARATEGVERPNGWSGQRFALYAISSADLPMLQPEVGQHEPTMALGGGPDGSGSLKRLVSEAAGFLMNGGVFLLETNGKDQSSSAAERLTSRSPPRFRDVGIHRDVVAMRI